MIRGPLYFPGVRGHCFLTMRDKQRDGRCKPLSVAGSAGAQEGTARTGRGSERKLSFQMFQREILCD